MRGAVHLLNVTAADKANRSLFIFSDTSSLSPRLIAFPAFLDAASAFHLLPGFLTPSQPYPRRRTTPTDSLLPPTSFALISLHTPDTLAKSTLYSPVLITQELPRAKPGGAISGLCRKKYI